MVQIGQTGAALQFMLITKVERNDDDDHKIAIYTLLPFLMMMMMII
jgi:hypothetical protein